MKNLIKWLLKKPIKRSDIISLLALLATIFFSWQSGCQSNKALEQSDKALAQSDKTLEIQERDSKAMKTQRDKEEKEKKIENLNKNAKVWLNKGSYENAFELYKNVIKIDSTDNEGYMLLLMSAKDLKALNNAKCNDDVMKILNMAKELKNTIEINYQIELCEKQ